MTTETRQRLRAVEHRGVRFWIEDDKLKWAGDRFARDRNWIARHYLRATITMNARRNGDQDAPHLGHRERSMGPFRGDVESGR
jgi:hypothetical protein